MKQYQEHHWSLSCPIQWLLFSLHGYLAKLITPLLNMFQTFSNTLLFSLPLLWPRCLGFFYWLSPYLNNNQTLKSVPDCFWTSLYSFYLMSWLDYRLKYHFISDSKINISNLDPPVPTKLQTSKIHLNLVSNKHFDSLNATKTDPRLSAPYSKPAFFMIFPISILFF